MAISSRVLLFFDGLEIIYFRDAGSGKKKGIVRLLKSGHHVPGLEILQIQPENTTTPPVHRISHGLDISHGLEIWLQDMATAPDPAKSAITARPNAISIGAALNHMGSAFHNDPPFSSAHVSFKPGLDGKTIKVEILDGEFFTSSTTSMLPYRFEIREQLPDKLILQFATVLGASISLSPGTCVVIRDRTAPTKLVKLEYDITTTTIYSVSIDNVPIPGMPHPIPKPTPPPRDQRPLSHFHFYYDVLQDDRGYQFDLSDITPPLDPEDLEKRRSVPPHNCDPTYLDPPPPEPALPASSTKVSSHRPKHPTHHSHEEKPTGGKKKK